MRREDWPPILLVADVDALAGNRHVGYSLIDAGLIGIKAGTQASWL
jgi:hypothetical protein